MQLKVHAGTDAADRAAQAQRERARRRGTVPERFEPQFWQDADGRCASVKEIKRRHELLTRDTGADSYQKDLIAQRAVFLSIQLETYERIAAEEGKFDAGVYTQAVNALVGLLKALGLERKVQAVGLRAYVNGQGA
jgi:hypothetical protein